MPTLQYWDGTAWKGLDGVAVAASTRSADAPASFAIAELTREVQALRAELDTLKALLADVMAKVG